MNIIEAFPRNFKELRNKFGYTQLEVADKLEVAPQTISKYEKGIAFPPGEKIQAILDLFKISPNELFRSEEGTLLDKLEERVKVHVELYMEYKKFNYGNERFNKFETPNDFMRYMNEEYLNDIEVIMADYFNEQLSVRKELNPIFSRKKHQDFLEIEKQIEIKLRDEYVKWNEVSGEEHAESDLLDE